jgi:hypothetical protein
MIREVNSMDGERASQREAGGEPFTKQKGRASKRLCRCFPLHGQLLGDNCVQVSGVSYLLPVAEALPLSDFAAGVFVDAGIATVDVIANNRKGQ